MKSHCLICATEGSTPAVAGAPSLRRCSSCAFVFDAQGPRVTYDHAYFERQGYSAYFDRAAQWRHEARLRLTWVLGQATPRRLLEVGCAGGFFVAQARLRGIEATGVERSAAAAAFARERLGVSVVQAPFEEVATGDGFDAVCAFHVLEHVDDPRHFLSLARGRLAAGGTLALEVPNIASARARCEGARWQGLQPGTHLWHFAPETLSELVRSCGFRVDRVETVFARLYRRSRDRLNAGFAAHALADARATGSPRATHPLLGDHVRLIARAA